MATEQIEVILVDKKTDPPPDSKGKSSAAGGSNSQSSQSPAASKADTQQVGSIEKLLTSFVASFQKTFDRLIGNSFAGRMMRSGIDMVKGALGGERESPGSWVNKIFEKIGLGRKPTADDASGAAGAQPDPTDVNDTQNPSWLLTEILKKIEGILERMKGTDGAPEKPRDRLPVNDPVRPRNQGGGSYSAGGGPKEWVEQEMVKNWQTRLFDKLSNSKFGRGIANIGRKLGDTRVGRWAAGTRVGQAATGMARTAGRAMGIGGRVAGAGTMAVGAGATAVGVTLGVFTVAIAGAVLALYGLSRALKKQADELEQYSGAIAGARMGAEMERRSSMFERARSIGPNVAKYDAAKARFDDAMYDLWTEIYQEMARWSPILEGLLDYMVVAVRGIESGVNLGQLLYHSYKGNVANAMRESTELGKSVAKMVEALQEAERQSPHGLQKEWILGQNPFGPMKQIQLNNRPLPHANQPAGPPIGSI